MGNSRDKPEDTQCYGCMQADPPKKLLRLLFFVHDQNCVREKVITPVINATNGPAT